MFYNNKYNKRVRLSSPDNYDKEYIDDVSSNICEKENEKNTEAEQINKVNISQQNFYFLIFYYSLKFL
jgi:hypothetical protein